jgi:NCS1 family nucleobase:cation symporter-1
MIAAVASIFITPWNLYNNPEVIHYTIDVLGAFIGPLFGILIADYYFVRRQHVDVDELYTLRPTGRYWYSKGYNPAAVWTMIPSALAPIACVVIPSLQWLGNYSWFIGMGIGLVLYPVLMRRQQASLTH